MTPPLNDITIHAVDAVLGGAVALGGVALKERIGRRSVDRQTAAQEQTADAAELSAEAAQLKGLIELLGAYRTELQETTKERNELRGDVRGLHDQVDRLVQTHQESEREHEHQLQRLHATVSALRTEVDNNATALAAQQQVHARELAARDREIADLRSGIAERDRRIDTLQAEVTALTRRIESGGARLQGEPA